MLLPNLRFRVPHHRFGSARCRAGTGGAKPRPSRAEQENPAVKIGREKPNKTPCGRAEQHPAPGWRESGWRGVETGGKVYGVGNNGFSWSTTPVPDSNNAYRSDFNPTWLNPQGNHYRAYAYQLRCLPEEGVKTMPKKNPAFKCQAARPRAAADTAPVCCTASATPGTSGRRRFRRGVAVPTTWTSTTSGSSRSISTAVRTVFSCVASRDRGAAGHAKTGFLSEQLSQTPALSYLPKTAPAGRASRRHPPRRELLGRARSSYRCRRPEKTVSQNNKLCPRTLGNQPDKLTVYRVDFLLRRGARWFEGTALRGRRPLRRAGAPTGRFIGHSAEKSPALGCRTAP